MCDKGIILFAVLKTCTQTVERNVCIKISKLRIIHLSSLSKCATRNKHNSTYISIFLSTRLAIWSNISACSRPAIVCFFFQLSYYKFEFVCHQDINGDRRIGLARLSLCVTQSYRQITNSLNSHTNEVMIIIIKLP